MKRLAAALLVIILLCGLGIPAAAQDEDTERIAAVMAEAIRAGKTEVDVSGLGFHRSMQKAVNDRLQQDPELYYYDYFTGWYYHQSEYLYKAEIIYREHYTQADREALEQAADQALKCVLPGMDPLRTALVLHDYLATHVAYDSENYKKGTIPDTSYTAYGALVLGTAVCQGYTQAYRLLLGRCGIPSVYVSSDRLNHGWALVCLGGDWYHVDVTWDDPTPDLPGRVTHHYFLLSDAAASNWEHRLSGWKAEHVCTNTTYDSGRFWLDQNTPIPFTDADTCWSLCEDGDFIQQTIRLVRWDWNSGAAETVASVRDYWPVWNNPDWYWDDVYSGLVFQDGRLFFNDKLHIYAYDPADGTLETVFTYTGGKGYLYGLTGDGDRLYYVLKQDANQEERTSCALSLPKKYPDTAKSIFVDVPQSAYYHDAVQWAYERKLTTGTSKTTFSPENACTRAQVVTFLWRAMGCPAPEGTGNPFADVPEKAYYRDAVLWAVEQGVTNGTGKDRATGKPLFSPDETCSYAHILTFLWRCLTEDSSSSGSPWYADALNWATAQALLRDTVPATDAEKMTEACPRGDVVTYLWRALRNK